MSKRKCAVNAIQSEFTLCGDAWDSFDTGDAEEQHELSEQGGSVTCPQCCRIISDIRDMRYRLKPRKETDHDQ